MPTRVLGVGVASTYEMNKGSTGTDSDGDSYGQLL